MSDVKLTMPERICLEFLWDKLYASASRVGKEIYLKRGDSGGSNLSAIGGAVLGRLKKRGLVAYLSDCSAWRITPAGRKAVPRSPEQTASIEPQRQSRTALSGAGQGGEAK